MSDSDKVPLNGKSLSGIKSILRHKSLYRRYSKTLATENHPRGCECHSWARCECEYFRVTPIVVVLSLS